MLNAKLLSSFRRNSNYCPWLFLHLLLYVWFDKPLFSRKRIIHFYGFILLLWLAMLTMRTIYWTASQGILLWLIMTKALTLLLFLRFPQRVDARAMFVYTCVFCWIVHVIYQVNTNYFFFLS